MKKLIVAVTFVLGLTSVLVAPTNWRTENRTISSCKKSQSKADKLKYYQKQIDKLKSEVEKLQSQS